MEQSEAMNHIDKGEEPPRFISLQFSAHIFLGQGRTKPKVLTLWLADGVRRVL